MPTTVFVRFDSPGEVPASPNRLHAALAAVLDLPRGISPGRASAFPTLAHRDRHNHPLADYRKRLPELPPGFEASVAVRSFTRSAFGWRKAPDPPDAQDADNVSYPVARDSGSAGISATTLFFKKREDNRVKAAFPDAWGRKGQRDPQFNLPTLDDDR